LQHSIKDVIRFSGSLSVNPSAWTLRESLKCILFQGVILSPMQTQNSDALPSLVTTEITKHEILVVDDEKNMRRILCSMLEKQGYLVHTAEDGLQAVAILAENPISVLITDIKMPNMDGMALFNHTFAHHPDIPVILITAHGTVDSAVEALKKGASDYITKPFDLVEMRQVVAKAIQTRELNGRNYHPDLEELGRFDIIGRSERMMSIYNVISKVADSPSTVLVTGENGTGKELVARALHQHSSRSNKPFIAINCAAVPHSLMESEFFGYQKGAFTGANTSKAGRFELADGGTLFLDEIGDIPIEMQVKLLRVLQERRFERVGGIETIQVDIRLIAATNKDLKSLIDEGSFREDLFYRLNVVPIQLPPLRDRREDIPLLVQHFLEKFNQRLSKNITGVTPEGLKYLQEHHWKGNIRELENVIERCVLLSNGPQITMQDLPSELLQQSESSSAPIYIPPAIDASASLSLPQMWKKHKERLETEMIRRALEQTDGNVTKASEILGISRKSMQKKMKDLGLRTS